jgi:hypothetical protein
VLSKLISNNVLLEIVIKSLKPLLEGFTPCKRPAVRAQIMPSVITSWGY